MMMAGSGQCLTTTISLAGWPNTASYFMPPIRVPYFENDFLSYHSFCTEEYDISQFLY
jgi:hypothetical protein